MDKLIACIEDIRVRLDGLRRRGLKETPTCTIIIDPLLQGLGWDIRDPDEVEHEYATVDAKAVDYALKLNRRPVLFVEAKSLDDPLDDVKAVAQIVRYAAAEGVVWCVLTNGARWRVYRSIEPCSASEKLMFEVSLDPKDGVGVPVRQVAERMWRFSRQELAKGTLDALGEQTFTDGKVRKALDALMRDPPRVLLNLVRHATGDEQLTPRRVRQSLTRIAQAGAPATAEPSPSFAGTPAVCSASESVGEQVASTPHRGRRSRKAASTWTEAHHTAGKPQEVLELYRAVERECLALRAGAVQKRHGGLWIGYEANGRTFCSVRLRHSGLRVSLHLELHRLPSPPSFARDVSNVGHWGAGDLELRITDLAQIQEAATLIRASFQARCGPPT